MQSKNAKTESPLNAYRDDGADDTVALQNTHTSSNHKYIRNDNSSPHYDTVADGHRANTTTSSAAAAAAIRAPSLSSASSSVSNIQEQDPSRTLKDLLTASDSVFWPPSPASDLDSVNGTESTTSTGGYEVTL